MYYQQPVASDASDARAKVLYVLYARAQHTVQCQYYYLVVRLSTTVFVPVRSVQLYSCTVPYMQCYSMYYYYTYCVVAIYHDCGIVILVQYRVPTGTMYE